MAYKRTPGYKYAESNPKGNKHKHKPKLKLTEGEERYNTASKKLAKMMDRADSIGDIFPSAATPKDTDAMLAAKMAYNEQAKPKVTKPSKTVKGKSAK